MEGCRHRYRRVGEDLEKDTGVGKKNIWEAPDVRRLDIYNPFYHFDDVVIYAKGDSGNYTDYKNINEWISWNILGN